MILSNYLAIPIICSGGWSEFVKEEDINNDGSKENINVSYGDCGYPASPYVTFYSKDNYSTLYVRAEQSSALEENLVFQVQTKGFSAAAFAGSPLFQIGQAVRLRNGHTGIIESFTFIMDQKFNLLERSAQVFVNHLSDTVDVTLEGLSPLPKQVRLLASKR